MNDLSSMARRINAREETIGQLKRRALNSAAETIGEVLLQGQDLLAVKRSMPHGQWLSWLSVHCPIIKERMAQRYMQLAANPSRVSDLMETGSLRQALLLLEENPEKKGQTKQWPPYLEAIGRLSKLAGYMKRFPVEQWPDEGLEKFREDLEPIAARLWPDKFK